MLGLFANIFTWLLGKLFAPKAGPSQEAVQAKSAGSEEVALAVETKSNDTVAQARAASDASIRTSVADPAGVRAPDPDSRD